MWHLLKYPAGAAALMLTIQVVQSVDLYGTRETSCFTVEKTTPIDEVWMNSVQVWYYALASRYELLRAALAVSGKSSQAELREDQIYYNSCIRGEMIGEKYVVTGFNGSQANFLIRPINGYEVFEFYPEEIKPGQMRSFHSTTYLVLTDNKTFALSTSCNFDGQMSWGVMSTVKTLPAETVTLILEKAHSLGFNPMHFTGLNYDRCNFDEPENRTRLPAAEEKLHVLHHMVEEKLANEPLDANEV